MRIVIGQANATPGDWTGNVASIVEAVALGSSENADLVVMPELMIPGYGYKDEYHKANVVSEVEKAEVRLYNEIAQYDVPVLFGSLEAQDTLKHVVGIEDVKGKSYNVARLHSGLSLDTVRKAKLPNDGIFDEVRTFTPGSDDQKRIFELPSGHKIAVVVCAEMWNPDWLLDRIETVDLIVAINASDWHPDKLEERQTLAKEISLATGSPFLYVNMCAGQDGIVFDGASFLVDGHEVMIQLPEFVETNQIIDLDTRNIVPVKSRLERLEDALVFGLREYMHKNNISKVVLGLSGGIDSALVAVLACKALGPENVTTIALPSKFNSEASVTLAGELATTLGNNHMVIPIDDAYEALNAVFQTNFAEGFGLAQENLQSRIRTNILMGYANTHNAVNLGGSNKSESFVGYSTLFGDLGAGYFPIADVCKTDVYALSEHINKDKEIIPRWIIDRPPSAELAEDQVDEDDLPPYDIIDAAMRVLVEGSDEYVDPDELVRIKKMFDKSEFKRWQMAPLTKVSRRSFGPDWRHAITRVYE